MHVHLYMQLSGMTHSWTPKPNRKCVCKIHWLVVLTILKKYEFVNGKDYPIYEMENKIHVWNHQPDIYIYILVKKCDFP